MTACERPLSELMDAAHTALTFTFESASLGSWGRDYELEPDQTLVDVHLRVLGEEFLRGIRIGLPGSRHPQPWTGHDTAAMPWGPAVVRWLDDLILHGCANRVLVEDVLGVLYFQVTPEGLTPI